jgi:hypothetical protein
MGNSDFHFKLRARAFHRIDQIPIVISSSIRLVRIVTRTCTTYNRRLQHTDEEKESVNPVYRRNLHFFV